MMRNVLVATDFSTRSDRALRRATLLARHTSARLILVHVVDDDQPARMVAASYHEAMALLAELAHTVRDVDGLDCDFKVALGEPFRGLSDAAMEYDVDLVVMGPYRRQVLREIFMGTSVERTIRRSRRPILMANAVPAQLYHRILVTTDFSDSSRNAFETARGLGLIEESEVLLLHVFDAPARYGMLGAAMTREQLKAHIADEEQQANRRMGEFIGEVQFKPARRLLRLVEGTTAETIKGCARVERADLIVIGTQGQSSLGKLLLGSIAESVLQNAEIDVLAVPLNRGSDAEHAEHDV